MVGISSARRAAREGIAAFIIGIFFAIIGGILTGLYARYLDPRGDIFFAVFLAITPVSFLIFGAWGISIGAAQYLKARRYIRGYPRYLG